MDVINGLTSIGVLTICLGLYKIANGRLNSKVNRDACHTAQKAIHDKIEDTKEHINQRFDDLKDFIKKSGKN